MSLNSIYDGKPTYTKIFGDADWICAPPQRLFSEGKVIYVSSKAHSKGVESATRWFGESFGGEYERAVRSDRI